MREKTESENLGSLVLFGFRVLLRCASVTPVVGVESRFEWRPWVTVSSLTSGPYTVGLLRSVLESGSAVVYPVFTGGSLGSVVGRKTLCCLLNDQTQ